ncbi:Alpha/Beta hydrolase protein [Infundibulicybe gibba]|nr:Alpha/Beta hydrolase protein [Infundibulicybe gibba]
MLTSSLKGLSLVFAAVLAVHAVPAPLQARQSITSLSSAQIAAFKPFSFFASAAYCSASKTLTWSCGANCNATPGFSTVASGGDGSSTQFWYVGYSAAQKSVIVAHQGTDPSKIEALATDADAFQESLDSSLFPGISSSVEVHNGFADEHAKCAPRIPNRHQILAAVRTAISAHSATHVTIVGHSLGTLLSFFCGAAIALLDGVYLPLHISGVTFTTIGYGLPRVGNQAFADYVDAHVSLTHINNRLPPSSGEVHIQDSGVWSLCPGQDNTSTQCIVGDISDHDGPYDGVEMGC